MSTDRYTEIPQNPPAGLSPQQQIEWTEKWNDRNEIYRNLDAHNGDQITATATWCRLYNKDYTSTKTLVNRARRHGKQLRELLALTEVDTGGSEELHESMEKNANPKENGGGGKDRSAVEKRSEDDGDNGSGDLGASGSGTVAAGA